MFSISHFIRDNIIFLIGIYSTIGIFFYYLNVWMRFCRRNPRGTIIPFYEPPEDLSPAVIKYLLNQCYDNKVFAVAIINMAIKGALKIKVENNIFNLERNSSFDMSSLSQEEQIIAVRLFGVRNSFEIINANNLAVRLAIDEVKKSLDKEYKPRYFTGTPDSFTYGAIASFLVLLFLAIGLNAQGIYDKYIPLIIEFCLMIIGFYLFVAYKIGYADAFQYRREGTKTAKEKSRIGMYSLLISSGISLIILYVTSILLYGLLVYALVGINFLFCVLLQGATEEGRKVLDQIDGFGLYLVRSGKESPDLFNPPDHTFELFEKYFPYAVALDIEDYWRDEFKDIFGKMGYYPDWLVGRFVAPSAYGNADIPLGDLLSKAITTASVDPNARR